MEKEKRKNDESRPNIFALIFGFIGTLLAGFAKGVVWIAQKIGKAILFTFKHGWQMAGWLLAQPYRLLRYIISGRIPEFDNARQEEIFWRVKRKFRRKRLFALNTFLYSGGWIISAFVIGVNYLDATRLTEPWAWQYFYNRSSSALFVMGIWTLILGFHYVFNRMGNAEDTAMGEALADEYARSEREEEHSKMMPSYERLVEPYHEYDDDYYDEKPKKNGARM